MCEGLGLESGLDKKFHEAPAFYWLYTFLIVAGAGTYIAALSVFGGIKYRRGALPEIAP